MRNKESEGEKQTVIQDTGEYSSGKIGETSKLQGRIGKGGILQSFM